jgi:predicted  nucleic acid-binding Zn-ribbon protein
MIKKVILVGVGGAILFGLLVGTHAMSYVRTSFGYVKQSAQEAIPIEFQIERARGLIKDLVPEVRKNMHVIAKEEVEVQRLEQQIADSEARLVKEKDQIIRLKSDLAEAKSVYHYASRTYTPGEVKTDLTNRFERFKTADATLASLKEIRNAREKSLEAARQKLEGMLAAKRQLQVEIENLEARSQMIAAAQTTSNYQFDDSRLGHVKELIANLKTRMEVAEKLVNAEVNFNDEIPLDKPNTEDIVDQVTEYFAPPAAPVKVASVEK